MSVPYLSPAQLADAMSDPEAAGSASGLLAKHYARPTASHRSFIYASLFAGSISTEEKSNEQGSSQADR